MNQQDLIIILGFIIIAVLAFCAVIKGRKDVRKELETYKSLQISYPYIATNQEVGGRILDPLWMLSRRNVLANGFKKKYLGIFWEEGFSYKHYEKWANTIEELQNSSDILLLRHLIENGKSVEYFITFSKPTIELK
jgi:hypothetical protein